MLKIPVVKNTSMATFTSKQQGITLLEVLISMVVMAIGMLGMAALQIKTLNTTQEGYSRAQVVALLEDTTDRVRTNALYLSETEISTYTTLAKDAESLNWCATPPKSCMSGDLCEGKELVKLDISQSCSALTSTNIANAKMGAICNDRVSGDAFACSQGSKMVLYASWQPQNRQDTDGATEYQQKNRCQILFGLDASETCVLVELVL